MNKKVKGVSWDKSKNKWRAYIPINGKTEYLGLFETYEEAVKARKDGEIKYGYVPVTPAPKLKHKDDLTQEMLKELLHYDPETGDFTWKVKINMNTKIGSIAGSFNKDGYILININYTQYQAHRLAFLYMDGKLPEKGLQVDHINHKQCDNRFYNLRIVNNQENHKNRTIHKNNKAGCTGVCWNKAANKWHASIAVGGKRKYLGLFDNIDDAIAARKAAEIKYGYHENHGKLKQK